MNAQALRHVNTLFELLRNESAPLFGIEHVWLVQSMELDWPEYEWPSDSLLKCLLEVLRLVEV